MSQIEHESLGINISWSIPVISLHQRSLFQLMGNMTIHDAPDISDHGESKSPEATLSIIKHFAPLT
jgi:hypothetical protein